MLQNAYFLAKIGAHTAENEQHFAEILPIGRRVADRGRSGRLRRRRGGDRRPGAGRGAGTRSFGGGPGGAQLRRPEPCGRRRAKFGLTLFFDGFLS